jgi:glycosyltransferase involved in cell wall biosynthesis
MSGWSSVADKISVVVISRNEGNELKRTVENFDDTLPADGEIIVIDDGSTDGSADHLARRRGRIRLHRAQGYGVARARNFGARQARGNVIVYADAHLRLQPDWWRPMLDVLRNPKVGGVAPAIDGYRGGPIGYGLTFKDSKLEVRWLRRKPRGAVAAPIIPGCCFATRREVIEATGGWDDSQLQRGNIDNEGCVRFWMLGYDLMITPDIVVAHKFRKRSPYYVGWPEFLFNRLRLAFVHFNPGRLGKVVGALRGYPGFGEALALLAASDIAERRRAVEARRVRDDDCYFTRFEISW